MSGSGESHRTIGVIGWSSGDAAMLIWQGEVGRQVYTDTGEGGDATWKLGGRSGEFTWMLSTREFASTNEIEEGRVKQKKWPRIRAT